MKMKMVLVLLIVVSMDIMSCKTGHVGMSPGAAVGVYKVTILYPGGEGKTFDMDYYEKKHMPMVAGFIGSNLKFYEIDRAISGRTSNDKPPFMAIGHFYITDIAEYNKSIAQNRDVIVNDFKNYTNIQPVVQISEIRQLVHAK